jgi:hypothetical protein
LTRFDHDAPECWRRPGKIGPNSAYAMKMSAITGNGHPIARRVPSSSSTINTEPITTSIGSGLPTRNARSSNIHGM